MADTPEPHPFFDGFAADLDERQIAFLEGVDEDVFSGRLKRYEMIINLTKSGASPRLVCISNPNTTSRPDEPGADIDPWTKQIKHEGEAWAFEIAFMGHHLTILEYRVTLLEYRFARYLIEHRAHAQTRAQAKEKLRQAARLVARIPGADSWF